MTRRRIIGAVILIALAIVAVLFIREQWQAARNAKTAERVSKGQAGAAIESGKDAVNTVGVRADEEGDSRRIAEEAKDAIRNANDAGAITNAGRDGLCRLPAYRGSRECVQQPDSD